MDPARNMSCPDNAFRKIGPIVGRERTTEVITVADIISGSCQPITLMMGTSAILTGYLYSRRLSLTPLARAVITYCCLNSSMSVPRMIRINQAVPAVPTTIIGTHK